MAKNRLWAWAFVALNVADGLTTWWVLSTVDGAVEGNPLVNLGWAPLIALKIAVVAFVFSIAKTEGKGAYWLVRGLVAYYFAVVGWNVNMASAEEYVAFVSGQKPYISSDFVSWTQQTTFPVNVTNLRRVGVGNWGYSADGYFRTTSSDVYLWQFHVPESYAVGNSGGTSAYGNSIYTWGNNGGRSMEIVNGIPTPKADWSGFWGQTPKYSFASPNGNFRGWCSDIGAGNFYNSSVSFLSENFLNNYSTCSSASDANDLGAWVNNGIFYINGPGSSNHSMQNWQANSETVAISDDGQAVIGAKTGGRLWKSTDSGVNGEIFHDTANWTFCDMRGRLGTLVAVCSTSNGKYTVSEDGNLDTWSSLMNAPGGGLNVRILIKELKEFKTGTQPVTASGTYSFGGSGSLTGSGSVTLTFGLIPEVGTGADCSAMFGSGGEFAYTGASSEFSVSNVIFSNAEAVLGQPWSCELLTESANPCLTAYSGATFVVEGIGNSMEYVLQQFIGPLADTFDYIGVPEPGAHCFLGIPLTINGKSDTAPEGKTGYDYLVLLISGAWLLYSVIGRR